MSAVPEPAVVAGVAPLRAQSRALRSLPLMALAFDALAVTVTVLLAAFGRSHLMLFSSPVAVQGSVARVALPLMVCWVALIGFRGGYDRGIFGAGADEYKAVVGASLLTAAVLGIGCYLTKFELSRGFFVFAFVLGPVLLAISRWCIRRWIHRERRLGALQQRTVMVGGGEHVDAIAGVLARESWLGYDVAGAITPAPQALESTPSGIPVLGRVEEAADLIRACEAEVVFVAGGRSPTRRRCGTWSGTSSPRACR